jgi:hypothetical protein
MMFPKEKPGLLKLALVILRIILAILESLD